MIGLLEELRRPSTTVNNAKEQRQDDVADVHQLRGCLLEIEAYPSQTGAVLTPKHSITLKRLCKIGSNYQRRLSQFGYFKMIFYFTSLPSSQRVTLPQVLAKILKPVLTRNPQPCTVLNATESPGR